MGNTALSAFFAQSTRLRDIGLPMRCTTDLQAGDVVLIEREFRPPGLQKAMPALHSDMAKGVSNLQSSVGFEREVGLGCDGGGWGKRTAEASLRPDF